MKQTQTRVCVPSFEEICPFSWTNKTMLRLNRILSVCLASHGDQSITEMVCHSLIEENIVIRLTSLCIVINVLHMYTLTQIKSQRRSPFFIILWLRTVLNFMITLLYCVSQLCIASIDLTSFYKRHSILLCFLWLSMSTNSELTVTKMTPWVTLQTKSIHQSYNFCNFH